MSQPSRVPALGLEERGQEEGWGQEQGLELGAMLFCLRKLRCTRLPPHTAPLAAKIMAPRRR